jgi:glycosyltransferase involved in cell wall biosynthesis
MHILHTVKKRGWSGETNSLLMLATGQASRGHRVTVAAGAGSETARRARAAGLEAVEVTFDRPVHRLPVIRDGRKVLRFLREQGVDVVHCHASFDHWVMALLAPSAGVSLVRSKRNRKDIQRHLFNRWLYRRTDQVVAISAAVADDLRATGFIAGEPLVIPNGIDLGRFRPNERERARVELGWETPVLAYVGRISERKRIDQLLAASTIVRRTIPDLVTVIAGRGGKPLIARLGTHADEAHTHFLGQRDDVARLLCAADVLCYPPYGEAFGLVPLEAMASGCPVVLSDEHGFRQFAIHDKNALLVPEGRAEGLAAAITRVLREPALADRLRHEGLKTAEQFSVDITVDRYLELYRALRERREAAYRSR